MTTPTPTPNPVLVAAIPVLLTVFTEFETFINTVLTGDPMQIPVRVDGASKILVGNLELQFPVLATAEAGAVNTDITAKLASWKATLSAMLPKT